MRIIHFLEGRCNPDSANGVEKTIFHLAYQQAVLGHEVHLVCVSDKPEIPIAGVCVRNFPKSQWPWALTGALVKYVLDIVPDIVHLHSMYVPSNVLLASKLRKAGIPYVVTPHGNCSAELLKRRPLIKVPFKVLLERPCLNRAVFVHSMGDGPAILEYGVRAPLVEAPNGIEKKDVPIWSGQNAILKLRPEWDGKTTLVFVGRLDIEQKGLDLLLSALKQATDQGADIGVVFVGPDWKGSRNRLDSMVQKLGLSDSVLFTGPTYGTDKYELIYSADFFIHSSRWEGMSFSVVEALACGKPCLVTKAANPCNLIGKYPCGWEVNASVESIAKGMKELEASSEVQRKAMSNAALELVDQELRWERIAQTMVAAYQDHTVK